MSDKVPVMELDAVTRNFDRVVALHEISLSVADGAFVSLLGPSGCGKSTTLRIMAGLDRPSTGTVRLAGRDVSELTASQRNVAMVFQSYALYPHLTVAENIALPLAMRDMTRAERAPLLSRLLPAAREKRARHRLQIGRVIETLGLTGLDDRKPAALSGGQKQRVALARALVRDPVMFLLDEPLSNLDARLRVAMRSELAQLHRQTGKPFVYVTHDQVEAMGLSDVIVVMMAGRIAQIGGPRDLYLRPATREVAGFIGAHPINFVETGPGGPLAVPAWAGKVIAGLRPEGLNPDPAGQLDAVLERVEYLGSEALLHCRLKNGTVLRATAPQSFAPPAPGDPLRLAVEAGHLHLFDSETGDRIDLPVGEPARVRA